MAYPRFKEETKPRKPPAEKIEKPPPSSEDAKQRSRGGGEIISGPTNVKDQTTHSHLTNILGKLDNDTDPALFNQITDKVLLNEGFEFGNLSGWTTSGTVQIVSDPVYEGSYSCKLSPNGCITQRISPPFSSQQLLRFLIAFYGETANDKLMITVSYSDGSNAGTMKVGNGDWQLFDLSDLTELFKIGVMITEIEFQAYPLNPHSIYVDEINLIRTIRPEEEIRYTQQLQKATDYIYFVEEVGAGQQSSYAEYLEEGGELYALSLVAEHDDIIFYFYWDNNEWGWAIYDGEVISFANLHALGDEDGLFKQVLYTQNGRCHIILKRPIKFIHLEIWFENPTGSAVTCRAEGKYKLPA